jgi:PST family polysaccharide transporter
MSRARPGGRLRRLAGHRIAQNALALYGVQVATFLVPLLSLPYLSRVLGDEGFGLVALGQSTAIVLGLVVSYGFEFTAGRDASVARNSPHRLAEIAARVLGARLLLAVLILAAAAATLPLVESFREHPEVLAIAWVTGVVQGINPGWFFVGTERLRLVSFVQLGLRFAGLGAILVLVRDADDATLVLLINLATTIVVAGVAMVLMLRRIPWRAPRLATAPSELRAAWAVFVGTGAIALYSSGNVVLLGFFGTTDEVAHFAAAERIVRAVVQLMSPVAVAVFPRLVYLHAQRERERAKRLARISIGAMSAIGISAVVVLGGAAGFLIPLIYGDAFDEAIDLLRVLVLILPLIGITSTLAGGWMMALRMDRAIVASAIRAGVTNIVLACVLVPRMGPEGLALSVVAAELVALVSCVWEIRRASRARARRRPSDRNRRMRRTALALSAIAIAALAALYVVLSRDDEPPADPTRIFAYDRDRPLDVTTGAETDQGGMRVRQLAYDGADGTRVQALLAVPADSGGSYPCLLYQGGLSTKKEQVDFLYPAAEALGIGLFTIDVRAGGNDVTDDEDTIKRTLRDPRAIAAALRNTTIDLRRGLDVLAQREECDPNRTGYLGVSEGGLIGSLLAGTDERIRATVLMVTGGDWRTILGKQSIILPGIERDPAALQRALRILAPYDPARWVGRISPRPILLMNGDRDPFTSDASAEALRRAARQPKREVTYRGGHDPFDAPGRDLVLSRLQRFLNANLVAPGT